MRPLVTAVLALTASLLASGMAAVALSDWISAGQEFILVFMVIAPVAVLTTTILMIAAAASRDALGTASKALLCLLGLGFAGLVTIAFLVNATMTAAWREVGLDAAVAGVCVVIVAVQWGIFHWRMRPPASPAG